MNFVSDPFFDREYAQFTEFNTFIQRFSADKTFQLSRVKFPILWDKYINGDTRKRKSTRVNWRHENVIKPSGDDYEVFVNYPTVKKPLIASVSETCKGGDCGYGAGLGFQKINGGWYCVSKSFGSD